ncbi:Male sterility NAD-binding [Penicillium frequentans]|nr:Male sterility NAD-binding [Penicillium glabrum]
MGSITPVQRTLLRITDDIAFSDPDRLYCVQTISPDVSQGWKDINFSGLVAAANRMALWIEENVAPSSKPETLAYVATNDVRYVAFVIACMRLRHTALLLSTRNSEQASRHVMGATGCTKIVYTPERSRQISELQTADIPLEAWEAPALWEVFDDSSPSPVIQEPAEDHEDRVAIYIHSSGTTGMPKPVPMTNGYLIAMDGLGCLPVPENRSPSLSFPAMRGVTEIAMSPFFHLIGIMYITSPMFFSTPFILSPDKPMTAELLAQIIEDKKPSVGIFPPSTLEDLVGSDLGVRCLKNFDWIAYGGAPLAPEVGDRIIEWTHLQTVLGTSETGILGALKTQDRKDWAYFEWNPNAGLELRDAGDGLFELVIPRAKNRDAQCIFHTYPDKTEYHTGDLFAPHPEKDYLWLYCGRKDDIIVLSNGEKFNPTTMEEIITGHPLVARSVVIGQGRFQSSVLVEPHWDTWNGDANELINEIWPVVKKANEAAPGHAQLMKNRVGVSTQSKPFELTPKGTIKRRSVLANYEEEINRLYANGDQADIAQLTKDATQPEVASYITTALSDILDVPTVDENADIFALGLDSLQTLRLGQILQASLRTARPDLGAAFGSPQLYSRPTVAQLTGYISDLLQGQGSGPAEVAEESDSEREARIADLVGKYTDDLGESHAVILTGSTGSLGAYLLSELLRDLSVTKIYCLNRSADAAARQLSSLQEKGLAYFKQFPRRVEFLQAQFGAERLGLEDSKYDELLQNVDTIIHNAWKVNFNHRVEAFEQTHIEGVRRLVEFSIASDRNAHIHFISSISTIEGYSPERGPSIPEVIYDDPSSALRQGYGESKHVSERICAAASARAGVPTSIHRVGQIGGPTTEKGMWNKQEWLPSLVATSKTLKQIPKSLGSITVQWVPVDVTAKVIAETVRTRRTTQEDEPCAAFHIVNPRVTEWPSLIPAVTKYFDVEPVDFPAWIKSLEIFTNPTEDDLKDKPALKILDFFQAFAAIEEAGPWTETTKTQASSKSLRELKAIDAPLMENWMNQWKF